MNFEDKELNKAYYDLRINVPNSDITLLWGGRGAGKTYSVYQYLIYLLWNEPNTNVMFFRNQSTKLRQLAYDPFVDVLKKKGIHHLCKCSFYSDTREIIFPSSNKIAFASTGSDGGEKTKGVAGYRICVVDEVNQVGEKELMAMLTSFREIDQRFIFMFNPVNEMHYLKKVFFDDKSEGSFGGRSTNLHYTCHDNKFATKQSIANLKALATKDMQAYNVQYLGIWGAEQTENPFYDLFNYNDAVDIGEVPFFPDYPVYLTWDFGVNEFCIVSQQFEDWQIDGDERISEYFKPNRNAINVLAEYGEGSREEHARGLTNIDIILSRIIHRFGEDTDYIVLGDSAGMGRKGKFTMIRQGLLMCGASYFDFPALRKKPTHMDSRSLCNWLFVTYKSNLRISKSCQTLINDMLLVPCDAYGHIDKNYCTTKNIGHIGDCFRYFVNQTESDAFSNNYKNIDVDMLEYKNPNLIYI